MKYIFFGLVLILLLGGGYYFVSNTNKSAYTAEEATTPIAAPTPPVSETATTSETVTARPPRETIGTSADGNDIVAYHFGEGDTELLFIGGIHGGYSVNTSLLAFTLIDHLEANPDLIPDNVTVTVIPVLNPDGLKRVTGSTDRFDIDDVKADTATKIAGRFNGNEVDLNRNFDCEWKQEGTWQSRTVSGGDAAFSEPEAAAIKKYVAEFRPAAAVVWYSAAGGVYASSCTDSVTDDTSILMNTYAAAADYEADDSFDFYAITGDMVNWLAKENIPAISVLLTDHTNVEWSKNRAGIEAVLSNFAE